MYSESVSTHRLGIPVFFARERDHHAAIIFPEIQFSNSENHFPMLL